MNGVDDQSIFKRELGIAPERVLAIAAGAFLIVMGIGDQLALKTIDEVALGALGLGALLVVGGIAGGSKFGVGLIAALVLAGLVVFGGGMIRG